MCCNFMVMATQGEGEQTVRKEQAMEWTEGNERGLSYRQTRLTHIVIFK